MNDAQIIDDVLSGDTSRFAALVDRYLPLVRGLCASHIQDPASRDDLIQESFVDSYLSLGRLRDRSKFGPWLARIARNKCASWIRRRDRAQSSQQQVARVACVGAKQDPLSELARREMVEWARSEIERLPRSTREAMSLHYLEERSIAETARFLGIKENAVKKRLQYGRQLLGQKVLSEFGEGLEKPEEAGGLKRRVLAAVPFGTIPWKTTSAAAASVAVGLSAGRIAAIIAVMVGVAVALTAWAQLRSPDARPATAGVGAAADPAAEPVVAAPAEVARDPAARTTDQTGELALSLMYRVGPLTAVFRTDPLMPAAVAPVVGEASPQTPAAGDSAAAPPVSGARVRLVPLAFDRLAFDALMREVGVSQQFADLFALRFQPVQRDAASWRRHLEEAGVTPEMLRRESERLREFAEGKEREFEARMESLVGIDPHRRARVAKAGTDGQLTFTGLGPGHWDVTVKAADDHAPWPDLHPRDVWSHLRVLIVAGERIERVFQVEDTLSTIRGAVVDRESGEAVPNAKLLLSGEVAGEGERSLWTDADGRFDFPSRQTGFGSFLLRCEADGFLPALIEGERRLGVAGELKIEIGRRATVSGYVRTAEGVPAPDVSIMCAMVGGSGSRGIASTDSDGFYSAPHDGGTLRLYAGGTTVKSDEVLLEPDPYQSVVQDFTLPVCATAVFDVRTADGKVPDAITTSSLDGANHSISGGVLDRRGDHFVIPYLQPGHYRLRFMVTGHERVDMEFDITESLSDPHFSVALIESALDLEVQLVGADGAPVQSAFVSLMWKVVSRTDEGRVSGISKTQVASATTDENGECAFSRLSHGTYEIQAGGTEAEVDLPGDHLLVLRMEPPAEEPRGLQLARDRIRAFDETRDDRPVITDEERPFVLGADGVLSQDLREGDNRVYVFKSGYPAAEAQVEIPRELLAAKAALRSNVYDRDVEVRFGESGALYGAVRRSDGGPRAGQRLRVYPAELWNSARENWNDHAWGTFGAAFAQGARTDDEGHFRVRFLAPGRYVVALSRGTFTGPVEIVAGHETGPVELEMKK